ncbi:MAG: RNA polymerase sporulation sigma factor SigK [Bacilli bacterium]|nr:RNA polymerase sporulation sigma factor SigK [Bacilli bacterium]
MFEFIINALKEISIFVGYIKNNTYPLPLDEKEEAHYISMLKGKDNDIARTKLIEHNLRLVMHIAKKYVGNNEREDDLFSIGTIGLIKAIDSYSIEKDVKLATYAAKCIENEILMHIRSNKKNYQVMSLSDTISEDKDGIELSLVDILASDDETLDDKLTRKNRLYKLIDNLCILDEKEKEIINLRYGITGKEYTQKEIAKKFKISRSYVSRIEKRALIKLLNQIKKSE